MVTPIIPIHHQSLPTTTNQLTIPSMFYKNVADFQDFMGAGHEGSYSSNKENKGQIAVFWLSVPTNTIAHSPSSKRRGPGSGVTT